jgi:uncharacterized membrane protein SirB2
MDPTLVRIVHQTAVTLSFLGFFARGIGAVTGADWVQSRAARTVPHVVDTILLLSAIALAWIYRLDPTTAPWLMAKIVGLFVYVGLGFLALKPNRPRGVRIAAWLGALAVFGWIVSVAVTKDPRGFLALL